MKYPHIVAAVHGTPWMITEEKLREILAFIEFKANGGNVTADDIALVREEQREPYLAMIEASDEPDLLEFDQDRAKGLMTKCWIDTQGNISAVDPSTAPRSRAGAVAVLPLHGTIAHRMGMMSEISGGTSTERFSGWLRAALADPQVKSIVIDIDSPGGTVQGVSELGDEIFKARQQKPIIAVANAQAASAAYWLAAQASEIVVTPSGEVGSIGVFAAHEDVSQAVEKEGVKISFISAGKFKTEANPYEPLSSEARDAMQAKVNEYYSQFTSAVARGRGIAKSQVESGFGEGRMVMAKDAVKQGMADRVATFDQTLSRLGARGKVKSLPGEFNREAAALAESPVVLHASVPNAGVVVTTAGTINSTPPLSEIVTISDPAPVANLGDLERRRKELELY
jgi:capsid assembly protease